jgi:hypothetical protein
MLRRRKQPERRQGIEGKLPSGCPVHRRGIVDTERDRRERRVSLVWPLLKAVGSEEKCAVTLGGDSGKQPRGFVLGEERDCSFHRRELDFLIIPDLLPAMKNA